VVVRRREVRRLERRGERDGAETSADSRQCGQADAAGAGPLAEQAGEIAHRTRDLGVTLDRILDIGVEEPADPRREHLR